MLAVTPALANMPAQPSDIAFGARPGNVIGGDTSLPKSDQASHISEVNRRSCIAPRLRSPPVVSDSPHDLLRAAVRALDAGRTGEAQEALERAETRLLSCSVPPTRVGQPSAKPPRRRTTLVDGGAGQAAPSVETRLPPDVAHALG